MFLDMAVFLLIFLTFTTERLRQLQLYTLSERHLDEVFGLVNALLLITSSWLVVEAIAAARAGKAASVARSLNCALLLAIAFCGSKVFEYSIELRAGITPASNSFFSFYYFITFVHLLHVVAGMIFLTHFSRTARRRLGSGAYLAGLENTGLYWHLVDMLWIFIFPMLYLQDLS